MKRFIIILTFFVIFLNCGNVFGANYATKDYKVITQDKFTICATLSYPKAKEITDFPTVVLLHSIGYNSEWWGDLPNDLLERGYAVLTIDLRGHGKSVYNAKLVRTSWSSLTNKAYAKYPDDVITVINYVKKENKRTFFNNWAIVGADIGASTAVLAANKIEYKPQTIVMLSPVVNTKGLYIPVKLAELDNIDILSITGKSDYFGKKADKYLKKFAQSTYAEFASSSATTGMIMIKHDEILSKVICAWIDEYIKK